MRTIQDRGKLVVGVDQNTLLLAYFNPLHSRFEGFEIDLVRNLANAIFGDPSKVQFVATTTDERIPYVQQGRVDIVVDAMTVTCDRWTKVDFSTIYDDAKQKLLVPINSHIHDIKDLAGKRVCATIGSTSLATLIELAPRAIPYPVEQRTDCLVALQQGRVDAVTSDDSILLGFKAQDPDTTIVGSPFADEPYGMAISKAHRDFVRFVNGVLAKMRSDGDWTRTYRGTLGKFGPTPSPPVAHYSG